MDVRRRRRRHFIRHSQYTSDLHTPKIGVPVQWWRSVGHSHTGFSVEAFLDEVAHAAKKDPYELRRKLLAKEPRMLGVLNLAAEKANWGKPLPKGVGRGIANSFFVRNVCRASHRSQRGKKWQRQSHRVVCAVDCGRVITPTSSKRKWKRHRLRSYCRVETEITLENGPRPTEKISTITRCAYVRIPVIAYMSFPAMSAQPG